MTSLLRREKKQIPKIDIFKKIIKGTKFKTDFVPFLYYISILKRCVFKYILINVFSAAFGVFHITEYEITIG